MLFSKRFLLFSAVAKRRVFRGFSFDSKHKENITVSCHYPSSDNAAFTAWKWKYSEMVEFRIRDHDSLESWGIQGAHLTWSILKYSARIHPNILCWVSFVDFPKRTLHKFHRPVIDGNNLSVMMKKIENLKDWKPFLILLDVGGFKSLETALYLFLGRTHLHRVFKSFLSVHIKLQEV